MKALFLALLAGAAAALPPNFVALKRRGRVGLQRSLIKTQADRVKSTEDAFLDHTRLVTVPFLQTKILDMHNSMKTCVVDFMAGDSRDSPVAFETMVEGCVGHDYSIMLRFYQETNLDIKEITKNDLKCVLSQGLCKRRVAECLEFLQVVNDFIEMDFDMGASVQSTRKSLGRRFGRSFYDHLINATEDQLEQYNVVNSLLKREKEFMEQFLANQYREWKARHGVEVVNEVAEEDAEDAEAEEDAAPEDEAEWAGEEGAGEGPEEDAPAEGGDFPEAAGEPGEG